MSQGNVYKPRYTLAYHAKSKVWPYKDSYLRRFYEHRARRVQRGGLFRRCVLVATTRKWTLVRRFIRPFSRRSGASAGTGSNTAFGHPRKRHYRDSFYQKQQLRFFSGKRKEHSFRQFFKQYQSLVGNSSVSFFSGLESRLDMFLFRRRLLPTIFASHQFIHYHGIEVNGALVQSPNTLVNVGDSVSMPIASWKPFYWDLFCHVYYRRWGLYLFRRRLYTQLKKQIYIPKASLSSDNTVYTSFENTFISYGLNGKISPLKLNVGFLDINKTIRKSFPLKKKRENKSVSGYSLFPVEVKGFFQAFFVENTEVAIQQSFRPFFQTTTLPARPTSSSKQESSKMFIAEHQKMLQRYCKLIRESFAGTSDTKLELFNKKLQQLFKLYLSLRLHKSLLPSVVKIRKVNKFKSFYYRPFFRKNLLKFYRKCHKKIIRRRKTPRLKSVHYYTPAYRQMDFRTLRAVKIQTAIPEDIYYPFRNSLVKIHSFYSSRGI